MADLPRRSREQSDSLPWLEPVEAEDSPAPRPRVQGTSSGRIVLLVVIALLLVTVVLALTMWLRNRGEETGPPGVIKAPEGPYKVPTDEVGGLEVQGQGDRTYSTSQGDDVPSTIDLSALPEAPLTDRAAPPAPRTPPAAASTAPKPAAAAAKPGETVPAAAKPAPAVPPKPVTPPPAAKPEPPAAAGTIQLGAFSSEAKANAAWTALSKRFTALAPLGKVIQPVAKDGSTLYRLRAAAGPQAGAICGKLRVAGESCSVVGN